MDSMDEIRKLSKTPTTNVNVKLKKERPQKGDEFVQLLLLAEGKITSASASATQKGNVALQQM